MSKPKLVHTAVNESKTTTAANSVLVD